jgi:hypothetical protein
MRINFTRRKLGINLQEENYELNDCLKSNGPPSEGYVQKDF